MKLAVIVFALLLLVSAPAAAQYSVDDYTFTFGGGFGAAIPASPDALTDVVNTNTSIGGFVTGRIRGPWSWRAELGFEQFTCDRDVCGDLGVDPEVNLTRIAGGVQYTTDGRAHGYGFFTLGAYQQELGASSPHLPFAVDDWKLAVAFGGGLNYMVGQVWGVGADLKVHAVPQGGDADTIWYVVPSGHLLWRF